MVTGKALAHTAVSTVAVNSGSVVTLIVLIVSQPVVVLDTVSVTDPTSLNTCPKMVTGKALAHTAVSTVAVNSGSVVTLIVLIVSQHVVVLDTVSVTDPTSLHTCPMLVTRQALSHTSVSTVVVYTTILLSLIVLIVSQPVVVLDTVSVTDPTSLNTCPKMVTGKALAHTAVSTVAVNSGSVVTLIVL